MTTAGTQQILDEVNGFLDTQTAYVEQTLARLDALRAAVIRRDEGALQEMYEQVVQETERKAQCVRAVEILRQTLARALDCPVHEVCLTRVGSLFEPPTRDAVALRQAQLQSLVRRLTNELASTQALLRECTRFNRLLLDSIFGGRHAITYDAHGQSRSNFQGGLMNLRF